MKILSALVDERPSECSACPVCSQVRSRAPCGEVRTIRGNGYIQKVKIPDYRCLLHVIKR